MDKSSQVSAQDLSDDAPKSFHAISDHNEVSRIALQHRAHSELSKEEKAQSQHCLHSWEATAPVKFLIQQDTPERSIRMKHTLYKIWPRFYKRHPELRASIKGALD